MHYFVPYGTKFICPDHKLFRAFLYHFVSKIEKYNMSDTKILTHLLTHFQQKTPASLTLQGFHFCIRDPVGIRTQDSILKRDVLYQLSYWVILIPLPFLLRHCKGKSYFLFWSYIRITFRNISSHNLCFDAVISSLKMGELCSKGYLVFLIAGCKHGFFGFTKALYKIVWYDIWYD